MAAEREEGEFVSLSYGEEEFQVPRELLDDGELFRSVLSEETWREVFGEGEREMLAQLLPPGPREQQAEDITRVLNGENVRFGNPVTQTLARINTGVFCPELREACQELQELQYQQYQHNQSRYYMKLLQDLLISRQEVMQMALMTGSLEDIPLRRGVNTGRKRKRSLLRQRAEMKFRKVMRECTEEWGEGGEMTSSDEDTPTGEPANEQGPPLISDEDYRRMLQRHKRTQLRKKMEQDMAARAAVRVRDRAQERSVSAKPEVSTGVGVGTGGALGVRRGVRDRASPADISAGPAAVTSGGGGKGRRGRRGERGRAGEKAGGPRSSAESKAVQEAYGPIEDGSRKEPPLLPIILTSPLPDCKFTSFFSLLKNAFDALHDRKGEISKVTKSVKTVLESPEVEGCGWMDRHPDWLEMVLPAIMYLSAEVGAVSSYDPLPFFYPILEFRDRIDHWKWMGHDRDSDVELLVLCNHWLDTLDRSLEIVDYSDYDPPTPINMWTNFVFRPSTADEVARFKEQESFRYSQPFKSYTYDVHGFEASVGPVKGAKTYKKDSGSRARGHALLIPDRPNCVTILSLVRDAASRLPNGEGTRVDLCVVVRDSQFIHEHVSDVQLNNAVSGALDRLHYEKDPCVRYDSTRKVWIYLHRGRNEEDFERIQWACDVAAKQRKMITTRPRVKPRILLRAGGGEVVLMEGGPQTAPPSAAPSANGAGGSVVKGEGGRGGRKVKSAVQTGSSGSGGGKKAILSVPSPSVSSSSSGGSVVVASVLVGGVGEGEVGLSPSTNANSPSLQSKTHRPHKTKKKPDQVSVSMASPSVALPPSSLPQPPTAAGGGWAEPADLPFLHHPQPAVGETGHESSSSWQSSEDELPHTSTTLTTSTFPPSHPHSDSD